MVREAMRQTNSNNRDRPNSFGESSSLRCRTDLRRHGRAWICGSAVTAWMIRQANQGAMMDNEQRARELRILADQCRGREDAAYRFEKGAAKLLTAFERETKKDFAREAVQRIRDGVRAQHDPELEMKGAKSKPTGVHVAGLVDPELVIDAINELVPAALSAEKGNTDGR